MTIEKRHSKTTSTNPAQRAGRQMSWGMLVFCLILVMLKYIS